MKKQYVVTQQDGSDRTVLAEAVVNNEGYLSFYNTVPVAATAVQVPDAPRIELVEILAPGEWRRLRNEGPVVA